MTYRARWNLYIARASHRRRGLATCSWSARRRRPGSALLRSVAHGDAPSLVAKLPARSRRAGGRQDGRVDRADVRDRQAPTGPRSLAVYSTSLFVLHSLSASDITPSARHQQRLQQSLNALRGASTQKYFLGADLSPFLPFPRPTSFSSSLSLHLPLPLLLPSP